MPPIHRLALRVCMGPCGLKPYTRIEKIKPAKTLYAIYHNENYPATLPYDASTGKGYIDKEWPQGTYRCNYTRRCLQNWNYEIC
jgi:hypothetical protein